MSESDSGLDPEEVPATVQRTPTVLILDTSGSMSTETETADGEKKEKIEQLNDGLEVFNDEVMEKEHASVRVDVALITFGGSAELEQDFSHIEDWTPPKLDCGSNTPMGDAIEMGIDKAEEIKTFYNSEGISYTRPLIWILTDGKPTDMDEGDEKWNRIQEQIEVGEQDDHFLFFAMGVGGADMEALNSIVEGADRPALQIKEGMFKEYFRFVSNSLEYASEEEGGAPDQIGDMDQLEDFIQTGG